MGALFDNSTKLGDCIKPGPLLEHIQVMDARHALAAATHSNPHYLWQVATGRKTASPHLAAAIELATDGKVPAASIRSDLHWVTDHEGVIGYVASVHDSATPAYVAQCIRNEAKPAAAPTAGHEPDAASLGFSTIAGNTVGDRIGAIMLTDPSKSTEGLHRHTGIEHAVIKDMYAGFAEPIAGSKRAKSIAEYLGVREEWLMTGTKPVFEVAAGRQQGSALDASAMAKPRPSTVPPVSAEPMVFLVDHGTTVDQCLSVAAQLFQQTEEIFEHECEDFSASTYGAWQLMRFGVRLVADAHLKLIAFEKGLPE